MDIERIKFERTGGFAGIRLAADFDLNDLPEDQKEEVLKLLDDLDLDELPEKYANTMLIPDEFVYSITIESEAHEYKVMAGESAVTGDMQSLIEILERMAKRQARKN